MRVTPIVAAWLVLLAACGGAATTTTAISVDPTPTTLPPPVAGTGLPAATSTVAPVDLEFAPVLLDGGIEAPVPVGWVEDERFPGVFRPPAGGPLDALATQWWVTAACAGACGERSAAEWSLTVEEDFFAEFYDAEAFTIRRNEEVGDGAVIVAENNFDQVAMHVARWSDGGAEMLTCQLSLPAGQAALLGAFERACFEATAPILGG